MKLEAQRQIRQHGQTGNWRFKSLLLAGLSGSGLSMDDVAAAWPTKPSEYHFLQVNPGYDPTAEAERTVTVFEDQEEFHALSAHADDQLEEQSDGVYTFHKDKTYKHMLFAASTPEEVDVLFREELADVVAEGAQRKQVARDGAFIFNAGTNKGDVTVADDRGYTYETGSGGTGEGGRIESAREGYTTVEWDCVKVDAAAEITDEMVRHAQVDLIERQVTHVGETVENNINRVFIVELINSAGEAFTATGSDARGVAAVSGAAGEVDENDFEADTLLTGGAYRTELFTEPNLIEVNRAGRDMELRDRELDRLMGLTHLPASQAAYDDDDEDFQWESSGDVGGVVYWSDAIWLIFEHDIEIKDYEDPIRDLQGVNARAWVDTQYAQADAASHIVHDA